MQHDLYTWQLEGKEFIHLKEVDKGSKFMDKAIKQWLDVLNVLQHEEDLDIDKQFHLNKKPPLIVMAPFLENSY